MALEEFHNPTLTWTCPYDGLETAEPENHLQSHGLTIEVVVEHLEALEKERSELARMLMLNQEVGDPCPVCGRPVE